MEYALDFDAIAARIMSYREEIWTEYSRYEHPTSQNLALLGGERSKFKRKFRPVFFKVYN